MAEQDNSADPGAALSIRGMSVRYGPVRAVSGISLDVSAGSCVALVGANGAGKTSILRGVGGLAEASAEAIRLAGRSIARMNGARRARLGLGHVLENRHVFADLSVEKNLLLGHGNHRARTRSHWRQARGEILELFPELAPHMSKKAGALSGGQQQMLAIARAYISEPTVLMLDEPSTGLAPRLVERVGEVIRSVADAGTAVLLVEQALDLVQRVADQVHILSHGQFAAHTTGNDPQLTELAHRIYLHGSDATAPGGEPPSRLASEESGIGRE